VTAFFTSDHHFGHKRIIELAKRPFTSVDEMDEYMIVRWNDRVKPGDTTSEISRSLITIRTCGGSMARSSWCPATTTTRTE
jgi:hypothetical protein